MASEQADSFQLRLSQVQRAIRKPDVDRAPSAGAALAVWPGRGWRKTDGQPSSGDTQVVGLLRKRGLHVAPGPIMASRHAPF